MERMAKTSQYKPIVNIENHDTIGMIALDAQETFPEHVQRVEWLIKCMEGLEILQLLEQDYL